MIDKGLRSEVAQQLLSDLMWKLHIRVKPGSLTSVFQQIESRKAHKTLRSAERAPTLSAGCKQTLLQVEGGFIIYSIFSPSQRLYIICRRKSMGRCPEGRGTNVP